MLDGANIALFGQNFAEGGWSFEQIEKVMNLVKEHEPGREQLVVSQPSVWRTCCSCRT
jgi:hypothetical protein